MSPDGDAPGWVSIAGLFSLAPIVTLFAYFYSYAHEIGFAQRFGYPRQLITIDLGIIGNLFAANAIFSIFLIFFLVMNLQYWPSTQRHSIYLILSTVLFYVAFLFVYRYAPGSTGYLFIVAASFGYLGKIALFRQIRKSDPFGPPIPNMYDSRTSLYEGTIAHFALKRMGFDPLLYCFIFLLVLPGAFWLGGVLEADKQEVFFLFDRDGRHFSVVRFSGTNAVAAPYDPQTGIAEKQFVLVPVTDLGLLTSVTLISAP